MFRRYRHAERYVVRCKTVVVAIALISSVSFASDWHVSDAAIRFEVQIEKHPTIPENGYFVTIPDQGMFPKPFFKTTVVDCNAGVQAPQIKSYVLWHSEWQGAAIIFEKPQNGASRVFVYLSPSPELNKWTEASGLKPSPFLVSSQGVANRETAGALASMGTSMPNLHWSQFAGMGGSTVCVPGDVMGFHGPVSVSQTFYYNAVDPGSTKFCKMPYEGQHDIRVNGKDITIAKFSGKRGGQGGDAGSLAKGLHKVDILCWNGTGRANSKGFMVLGVVTPNMDPNKMGGINKTGDGQPFWACRMLEKSEVTWSGTASVQGASMKDGSSVAHVIANPVENFWIGDRPPVYVYELSPHKEWCTDNSRFLWTMQDGAFTETPSVKWLFTGNQYQSVNLKVYDGSRASSCSKKIYPYSNVHSDMNNIRTRENYRNAVFDMISAYPGDKDPTETWPDFYWDYLFDCLEINQGKELIAHLVNVRWESLVNKLGEKRLEGLRDICLDFAPRISPQLAFKWIDKFKELTKDERQQAAMDIARADVFLFYLDDLEMAKQIYTEEARKKIYDPVGELALVRLGDIAFIEGKINDARQIYAIVQGRAKHKKEEEGNKVAAVAKAINVADWKADAFLSAAASETVISLMEQGFLKEAKQSLCVGELEFPLNKINGDYILNESKFYMALEDYQRAKIMLEPYCGYVDSSSFLAKAVQNLLYCKRVLKENPVKIAEFCEKMEGKLKFHPVADELRYYIKVQKGEIKVGTSDKPEFNASATDKALLLKKAMEGN